jgi:hypothetical protein
VPRANVTSIESVERFRGRLVEFGKELQDALSGIEMHIRRTFDWLDEQAKHWKLEIRKREEEVTRAKIELQSRKAMCKDGRGPGTTDQEKALRKAQTRLKEAEEKAKNCKKWVPLLQHEVHEYHGPARLLGSFVETEFATGLAILKQKLAELDAYLSIAAPSNADWVAHGTTAVTEPPPEPVHAGSSQATIQEASREPQQQRDGNEQRDQGPARPLGRDEASLE